MQYLEFRIKNYKGIRDTTIVLPRTSSNPITLIGLNESGKTTILEAIYSFSPDRESEPLFVQDTLLPDATAKIPRDKLFSFTDRISVKATVGFRVGEKEKILQSIGNKIGGSVDPTSISDQFTIEDWKNYVNSELGKSGVSWDFSPRVKTGRQKKWRSPTAAEWKLIYATFREHLPSIAYFPTFLSQVPNRIYLSGHSTDRTNTFYRTIFQDILYQVGPTYTIKSQILDRLSESPEGLVSQIIAAFWGSPKRGMVQQLIDKASAILSNVITDRWNDIFKTRPAGREIVIHFGLDENDEEEGIDPYVEFAIKDGANRFNIADRSLGFRWFFCFLLFTQFRAKRQNPTGTLFLFDEPASNLHAKAQEKLLDSFKDVSKVPNTLIYSTHSPYMIDPIWLDEAYVIENSLVEGELKDIGEMSTSEETDIVSKLYRSYVDEYPDRVSHFQPILDRLEVKPSLSEISEKSLLVEGKSDYAIITRLLDKKQKNFKIIPAHGATTLGALVGLLRGWGWKFAVLLDSDPEGAAAAEKYREDFSLDEQVINLEQISTAIKEIENFLSQADRQQIPHSGKSLSKKEIYKYFKDENNSNFIRKFDAYRSKEIEDFLKIVNSKIG